MAKKPTNQGKKNNMTDATTNAGGKLSLEQKIANTEALLAKYKALQNSLAQINNVQVGDDVTFKFGRAEKARNMDGKIIAVGDTPQGRVVAVQVGEGLDVKTIKVRAADIVSNPSADARNGGEGAPEAAGDEDPLSAA